MFVQHPFPAAINDCVDAYKWLLRKVHPSRILFAGDSAGGGLVVSTMLAAIKENLPRPTGGILLSPW